MADSCLLPHERRLVVTERPKCPTCGMKPPTPNYLLLKLTANTRDALMVAARSEGVSRHKLAEKILDDALKASCE